MHMLLAETGAFGSTCFTFFLILALVGWALERRKRQREAEAQRQQSGPPSQPSLGRKIAVGIGARLLGAIVTSWLGHRHHGHHHDRHGD